MKKEIVLTVNEKEKFHIRLDFNSIIDPQVDFKSSTVHYLEPNRVELFSDKIEKSRGKSSKSRGSKNSREVESSRNTST